MIQRRSSRRQLRAFRKRRRADLRRVILIAFVVLFLLPVMAIPAVAAQTVGPLPQVGGLSSSNLDQDTLIYDRHGTLLADIGRAGDHRIVVPLSYVSPFLAKATLAIEDRTFYTNMGIDVGGIVRAALANYTHHQITQGGSTISQQLVKQVFIGPNPAPTIQRKLKEAILALELNRRYSKKQILEMYLNTIYYGEQNYGVEAAARSYFHSNAHDLTLAQAALLAGLPQAPTRNDPLHNLAISKARQKQVLEAMVTQHDITPAQAAAAWKEPLQIFPAENLIQAPHFVDYVLKALTKMGLSTNDRQGYRVTTSLDLNLQHVAEQVVHDQVAAKGNYYNFHDAALVSMDPKTGEILAMVGGYDYNAPGGQFNMADSPRQPGSSFKIFTYTAAIESRTVNMVTPILDEPLKFPIWGGASGQQPYVPLNYDLRFHGTLPVKMAMGNSLNIPALKVEMRTGIPAVVDVAHRMGITCLGLPCDNRDPSSYGISLTLGGYEVRLADMATAVSTLATMGVRHREAPILSIEDGLGRKIWTYDPQQNAFQAISPQVAFIIASIMSDDRNRCMEFGCHGDLTLPGRLVGAKTGTTQSFKDNWTVGFTPTLATAVWVGNPDNRPLNHNSTGIVGAAPIWHNFMVKALAGTPAQWYPVPAGVDAVGGNYFLPGSESLKTKLGDPWPACKFTGYNPNTITA
ncbi:MAG TPA: transglycosylase domain-containing protein, partial [Candidatus Sulfotelmatobacter sp.]|nr:transglycosylase domain-containing protein [Candidatus Sulfotelmatobacter sp.]